MTPDDADAPKPWKVIKVTKTGITKTRAGRSSEGGKTRGFGSIYRRKAESSGIWWIAYMVGGRRHSESSKSSVKQDAKDLLEQRRLEVRAGTFTGRTKATSFDELVEFLEGDYKKKQNSTLKRALQCVAHLRETFERLPATAISYERMDKYATGRLEAGAAHATVKQEIAILGRMLTLAVRAGRISARPPLPEIAVSNVRTGFFDDDQLEAVLARLPEPVASVVAFAALTGWRRAEVLGLRWSQVDWDGGVVRLEVGTTKNGEGRIFPFSVLPDLGTLLKRRLEATQAVQKSLGCVVPWVFHREGRQIVDFRTDWGRTCRAVGVPGRMFHDLRRTAVRNLERAGVPRAWATKLTGHLTESVYRRYAIVSESDLAEGVERLAESRRSATNPLRSGPSEPSDQRPADGTDDVTR